MSELLDKTWQPTDRDYDVGIVPIRRISRIIAVPAAASLVQQILFTETEPNGLVPLNTIRHVQMIYAQFTGNATSALSEVRAAVYTLAAAPSFNLWSDIGFYNASGTTPKSSGERVDIWLMPGERLIIEFVMGVVGVGAYSTICSAVAIDYPRGNLQQG